MSEAAHKVHFPSIYVSDYDADDIVIYNALYPANPPIGTITSGIDGPTGTWVDGNGQLFVANENGGTVSVYARGQITPYKVFRGLTGPIGVAVGANGTVYVPEFEMNVVLEFDRGASSPSREIAISQPEGVALDGHNNLYVSYNNTSTGFGQVEKFAPKATVGKDLGIEVSYAGDVKLDQQGDVLLGDQIRQVVNFYRPGGSTPYGSISVGGDVFKFALNSKDSVLYVADIVDVPYFNAAPGSQPIGTITSGLESAYGESMSPAAPL
jgi:hypothetical protein